MMPQVATIYVSSLFETKDGTMALCNIQPQRPSYLVAPDFLEMPLDSQPVNSDFVVKLTDLTPAVEEQLRGGWRRLRALLEFEDAPDGRQLKITHIEAY